MIPRAVSPFYVASTILNMAACEVAIDLKTHGPVNASALACASGTAALLEARRLIGDADLGASLRNRFRQEVVKGTGAEFVAAKLRERDQRHAVEPG